MPQRIEGEAHAASHVKIGRLLVGNEAKRLVPRGHDSQLVAQSDTHLRDECGELPQTRLARDRREHGAVARILERDVDTQRRVVGGSADQIAAADDVVSVEPTAQARECLGRVASCSGWPDIDTGIADQFIRHDVQVVRYV